MSISTRNVVGGALMLGAATGVGYAAMEQPDWLSESVSISAEAANPSTAMSDGFNNFMRGIELAGGTALAYGAYRQLRKGFDPKARAIGEYANASRTTALQKIGGGLALSAATTMLIYSEVAQNLADGQETAGTAFLKTIDRPAGTVKVISNTPSPELFNDATVPAALTEKINPKTGQLGDIRVVPVRRTNHNIFPDPADTKKKLLSPVFGLPEQFAGLPASEDCSNVEVSAPKELGKKVGDTIGIDGLRVKVGNIHEGNVGMNLFPVFMNERDYAPCLLGQPDQSKIPANFLLTESDPRKIPGALAASGANNGDPANRAFIVPAEQMAANTKATGENTANGMVALAVLIGSGFILSAIGAHMRGRYIKEQGSNAVLMANGLDKKDAAQIYREWADSSTLRATAVAVGGAVLITAMANRGMPGATLGVSPETALGALGYTWGCTRLSNRLVARKELDKSNIATERTTE